jgi:hypothetical protein
VVDPVARRPTSKCPRFTGPSIDLYPVNVGVKLDCHGVASRPRGTWRVVEVLRMRGGMRSTVIEIPSSAPTLLGSYA